MRNMKTKQNTVDQQNILPEEVPLPMAQCPKCDEYTVVALTNKPRTLRCKSCWFEYQDPKKALVDLGKEHVASHLFA